MTVKATIKGQEVTLNFDSATGQYKASVTAPSDSSYQNNEGHYFPVSITATDDAGNSTTISDTQGGFTENLKLYVKERIVPKVTGISPSSDANVITSNPKIEFTVLDNANGQSSGFSGINPNTVSLVINGSAIDNSAIEKTPVTGGYKCTYTPVVAIPDGTCTFTVQASDYDENQSDLVTTSFKVDTAPPALDITYPTNDMYTNESEIEVIGTTSDVTSSPVEVVITVNGKDQGDVEISADGSFRKTITLDDGTNTIKITSTDRAGKISTVTKTVYLKTSAPIFKSVRIEPNPVDHGQTYTIYVEVE